MCNQSWQIFYWKHINELVQERRNSNAYATFSSMKKSCHLIKMSPTLFPKAGFCINAKICVFTPIFKAAPYFPKAVGSHDPIFIIFWNQNLFQDTSIFETGPYSPKAVGSMDPNFEIPSASPAKIQLKHWGLGKMAATLQTTFPNVFSWMKLHEFRLKFHWSLFLWVQLTIFQHWFRSWIDADQATSHYLNQWWLVYQRIYAWLCPDELKRIHPCKESDDCPCVSEATLKDMGKTDLDLSTTKHMHISWHTVLSESPTPQLFVQKLVQAIHSDKIKAPQYWPFVMGIHRHLWIPITEGQ